MSQYKSRKPKPAQLEVHWTEPESFALITQSSVDGNRIAREAAQLAADKQESAQLQNPLL